VTLREVLSLDHRPLHDERSGVESPADEEFAIHPELRLDAPPLVRSKFAPKVGVIGFADEFE
jgi:hypothetical protein